MRFPEEINNCQLPTPPMKIMSSARTETEQNQHQTIELHATIHDTKIGCRENDITPREQGFAET